VRKVVLAVCLQPADCRPSLENLRVVLGSQTDAGLRAYWRTPLARSRRECG